MLDLWTNEPLPNQIRFNQQDVLEVGCGAGRFTLAHLTQAQSILGLDPSAEAIASLQASWPAQGSRAKADFRQGSIVDFTLPTERYDIAIFSRSL